MVIVKYETMPAMRPLPIPTKDKGFFGAVIMWLIASRQWQLAADWKFTIDGVPYVIPAGFTFDGASIPKFLWTYLSPTGVLLMPGLIHDWVYKYKSLKRADNRPTPELNQKECDALFCDLAIAINGFKFINKAAYLALRAFGWMAWNKHRKND
jgi:hypothetical protein